MAFDNKWCNDLDDFWIPKWWSEHPSRAVLSAGCLKLWQTVWLVSNISEDWLSVLKPSNTLYISYLSDIFVPNISPEAQIEKNGSVMLKFMLGTESAMPGAVNIFRGKKQFLQSFLGLKFHVWVSEPFFFRGFSLILRWLYLICSCDKITTSGDEPPDPRIVLRSSSCVVRCTSATLFWWPPSTIGPAPNIFQYLMLQTPSWLILVHN